MSAAADRMRHVAEAEMLMPDGPLPFDAARRAWLAKPVHAWDADDEHDDTLGRAMRDAEASADA